MMSTTVNEKKKIFKNLLSKLNLIIYKLSDAVYCPVSDRRYLYTLLGVGCMYYLSVSDIDTYMAYAATGLCIEEKVAGLCL